MGKILKLILRPAKKARPLALLLALLVVACVDPKERFLGHWLAEHAPRLDVSTRQKVARALLAAERDTGIDAFLLLAVVEQESHYDPSARSRKGARGLMQLRPETARHVAEQLGIAWSGAGDLDDPATNLRLGAAYLAELREQFEDWQVALAAYHQGPTKIRRIERRGGRIPKRYATRVLGRWERIQKVYTAQ